MEKKDRPRAQVYNPWGEAEEEFFSTTTRKEPSRSAPAGSESKVRSKGQNRAARRPLS